MHTEYKVKEDTSTVRLSISIGYGQAAQTRLMFGTDQFGEILNNSFNDVEIGSNIDLKGKSLSIFIVAHDINPSTNKMVVSGKIEGGVSLLIIPPDIQVVSNGGVAYFIINIDFY
ncbi:MAG: hypothetical protein ISS16_03280 [Ignavibacteria bacterium]|nr:hypothetical protein [Ignavibacteria bacterium]